MNKFGDPYTQNAIVMSLRQLHLESARFYTSIPADRFFAHSLNAWSPAENLEHLIRSVKPVAQAMRLPKLLLQLLFGTASTPSRSFQTIKEEYLSKLANGARAARAYLPTQTIPSTNLELARMQLLSQWTRIEQELINSVKAWHESEFDKYLLPHPLLGKLTVREMLFFTLYHNRRHIFAGMD